MRELSTIMKSIYNLEISLGNEVVSMDENEWSMGEIVVNFKCPIHHMEIDKNIDLGKDVEKWECRDPHYPRESGYRLKDKKEAIAGPLRGNNDPWRS